MALVRIPAKGQSIKSPAAIRLFQNPSGWNPNHTHRGTDRDFQPVSFGPACLGPTIAAPSIGLS